MKKILFLLLILPLFISCGSDEASKIYSVTITSPTKNIYLGDRVPLKVIHYPSEAATPFYSWTSSNTDVATISSQGMLIAISEGETTITATAKDPNLIARLDIRVDPVTATSITLNKKLYDLKVGEAFALTYTIEPKNAVQKKARWVSSNTDVATVDEEGIITGISEGDAIITASIGEVKDECTVKVTLAKVEKITLNEQNISLEKRAQIQLLPIITPENASNKKVTWSSSNPDIATVDKDGYVTGKSLGSTIISATTEDGKFKAECSVMVTPIPVTGISLSRSSMDVLENTSNNLLTFSLLPYGAENRNVTFSSSNPDVATWHNGVLTAYKIGQAVITARTEDGGHEATCIINVVDLSGMVNITFGSSSTININGTITAKVKTFVNNPSEKDITDVKIGIRSANSPSASSFSPIGNINSYQTTSFELQITSIYRPIIECIFNYQGHSYKVEKEFDPQ